MKNISKAIIGKILMSVILFLADLIKIYKNTYRKSN